MKVLVDLVTPARVMRDTRTQSQRWESLFGRPAQYWIGGIMWLLVAMTCLWDVAMSFIWRIKP